MLKSPPNVSFGEFAIERWYDVPPARVFGAWAEPEIRAQWFAGPDHWTEIERSLDFRVGGTERLHGRFSSGLETLYAARFHVIEPERRIVSAYDMHVGGAHHSVSLGTLEMKADRGGTRFRYAEQLVFLDGTDAAKATVARKHGTGAHFDRMLAILVPPAAGTG